MTVQSKQLIFSLISGLAIFTTGMAAGQITTGYFPLVMVGLLLCSASLFFALGQQRAKHKRKDVSIVIDSAESIVQTSVSERA